MAAGPGNASPGSVAEVQASVNGSLSSVKLGAGKAPMEMQRVQSGRRRREQNEFLLWLVGGGGKPAMNTKWNL